MKLSLSNLFLLLITFYSCSNINSTEDMKKQFDIYFQALNDHDTETILACLSEDFQLRFSDYDFTIDKKGMVDVLGWDKGANGRVAYKDLVVEGDSVSGLFTEENDFFKLIGIQSLRATISYSFDKAGLIKEQNYTPLPGQPSFQEKMQIAVEWARIHRPEELKEIYPQGQIRFNEKMARRWVALLREWKTTKKE